MNVASHLEAACKIVSIFELFYELMDYSYHTMANPATSNPKVL
jgi:hypothetical protein